MPNTASYVAVEHKLYQTFQMLLFAVFMLNECTARTWLPSLACVGKASRSSSSSLMCGQARRGQKLRVTRNFCGCVPDANTFVVVPGFRGASPCILWFPRVKSPASCWARRTNVLRHEGLFVDTAKLCLKTSFCFCVPEVLRGSKRKLTVMWKTGHS